MIIEFPYDRERAVEYAKKWALSRNPLFLDFTGRGGNCTSRQPSAGITALPPTEHLPGRVWNHCLIFLRIAGTLREWISKGLLLSPSPRPSR